MRLLDRYLLRQMIVPFLIGVAAFAVILIGDEARRLGQILGGSVSIGLILSYLALNTPQALVWSLPVGTLVGVAMTATSQARAGETVAMQTGGISFPRLCIPFLLWAVVATASAFGMTEIVVPDAMKRAKEVFRQMTFSQAVVREERDVFFRDEQGRIFHVGVMNPERNELERVTIWELDGRGRPRRITAAARASLDGRHWLLRQGASVTLGPNGQGMAAIERFESRPVLLWRALQDYYTESRTPLEMSARDLGALVRGMTESGAQPYELATHLHFKYSIPFACLVFALMAAPLADRYAQHGVFVGILISVLLVFFYNGIRSWGLAFGMTGALYPWLAAWMQNIIFGAAGLVLMWRRR